MKTTSKILLILIIVPVLISIIALGSDIECPHADKYKSLQVKHGELQLKYEALQKRETEIDSVNTEEEIARLKHETTTSQRFSTVNESSYPDNTISVSVVEDAETRRRYIVFETSTGLAVIEE
jgi:hypothetical protein